jgi:hypothetical protein
LQIPSFNSPLSHNLGISQLAGHLSARPVACLGRFVAVDQSALRTHANLQLGLLCSRACSAICAFRAVFQCLWQYLRGSRYAVCGRPGALLCSRQCSSIGVQQHFVPSWWLTRPRLFRAFTQVGGAAVMPYQKACHCHCW